MTSQSIKNNYALVTGASGGIGLELAKQLAAGKFNLVLVARNQTKLDTLSIELSSQFGIEVITISKDLSQAGACQEVFEFLHTRYIEIEILVNNAGFATSGAFANSKLDEELQEIQLNITTVAHLTKLFLPAMIDRHSGKILNVASIAAYQPGPFMAIYYASKAFVLSFSEALSNEVQHTGVSVTALCPGPTSTDFDTRAGVGDLPLFNMGNMSAEEVAAIGYQGLMSGRRTIVPGFRNKIMVVASRFIPKSIILQAVRRIQSRE